MADEKNSVRRAVVLFDIDGTLIRRAGPHHRQALVQAVHDVTGIHTSIAHIATQGMLDRDIIRAMLQDSGAAAELIQSNMEGIVSRAQKVYVDVCPDLSGRTCPGSIDLLKALRDEGIPAGLVTGNLTAIAWKKMESAGLREYLQFGAFAEMGTTRAELVGIAIEIARARGWVGVGTKLSLIGDHPNDVDAARRNEIRSVAVCTGVIPRRELEACKPDLVVDDLRILRVADLL